MSDYETKTEEQFEAVRVEFSVDDDESARRIEAVLGALGFNPVRDRTRHETNSKFAVPQLREAANECFEALASMNPEAITRAADKFEAAAVRARRLLHDVEDP